MIFFIAGYSSNYFIREDLLDDVAPRAPPGRHDELLVEPDCVDDAGGDVVGRDEGDLGADAAEHVGRHEERSNDRHGDLVPPEALQVKLTPENRAGVNTVTL